MRKKKEVEGLTLSIDIPDAIPKEETPTTVVKKKKELSEKQRNALKKGMEALREKRKKVFDDEDVAPKPAAPEPVVAPAPIVANKDPVVAPPPAPAPVEKVKKIRKPRPTYLTADDFNIFKNDLFTKLRSPSAEPIVQPTVQPTVQPVVLSGVSLLDEIFFKRK